MFVSVPVGTDYSLDNRMTPEMQLYLEEHQPASASQIAEAMGITRQTVYEQVSKTCRIAEWDNNYRGQYQALYVIGRGNSPKKPASKNQKERSKKYHEQNKALIKARRPTKTMINLGIWSGLK